MWLEEPVAKKLVLQPVESVERNLGGRCSGATGTGPGLSPSPYTFPKEVRDHLKILAVEQGTTLRALVGESFNMLFAKYRKPEVAPTARTTTIHP